MSEATRPAPDLQVLPSFLQHIGVYDLEVEQGQAKVRLTFDDQRHANGIGVAHGGVICTLLDVVMGYSAFSWGGDYKPIVTVDQSVQFMGSLRGAVQAQGRVTRGGRSLIYCSAEILDDAGEWIASGIGTFKRVERTLEQHTGSHRAPMESEQHG